MNLSITSAVDRQPAFGTPLRLSTVSAVCTIVLMSLTGASAPAATKVAVIVGTDAPAIERRAADDLAVQLEKVFRDVDAAVTTTADGDADQLVLVGSPASNAAVSEAAGDQWPQLSKQGIVIRSLEGDRPTLLAGGGSPTATMWAVYELGHRFGVRYLFRGDYYPNAKKDLDLSGYDVKMEPELKTRTWRTVNDFAVGPESWGLEEHKRFLRQLAKMKFNRLMLSVYPWHPFVSYEFRGVRKQQAVLWWGKQYPVDGDTVGKKVFRGSKLFENPDFAGLRSSSEMMAAGRTHIRGLIDAAHELGMTVGISVSPLEFPKEFQSVLPGSRIGRSLNNLTIVPAADQGPDDGTLRELAATKLRAYLETYPDLDRLYLTLPEFPEWDQHADRALEILKQHGAPADMTVDQLVAAATQRHLIASGERGEQAVRGNLVGLAFLQELFSRHDVPARPNRDRIPLVITSVDPALYPVLEHVVPRGSETLHFIDYTARRIVENKQLLGNVPASKVPSQLILTLADDNVGMLPQSALQSIAILTDELKRGGWDGFSTRYWVPAELDPAVYFLSRASWERSLSARDCHTELFTTMTGNSAAAERLWFAWEALEKATATIDRNDIGFAFPVPGMLMKHYRNTELPDWWETVTEACTNYMTELYRSHGAIDGDAKPLLFYYAKRGEYVLEYLGAVKAVREAGIAKAAGDTEKAIEHLEAALELTYNCINTLSDVAQDQSDRGLIAVLNAHAYRPLMAEYEKLLDE